MKYRMTFDIEFEENYEPELSDAVSLVEDTIKQCKRIRYAFREHAIAFLKESDYRNQVER